MVKTVTGEEESKSDNNGSPLKFDGDSGDGSGGGNDGGSGGNGGGGGNENEEGGNEEDEKEFGPLLKFAEVMKVAESRGVNLPSDMMEAAETTGIREMFLHRYLELQVND